MSFLDKKGRQIGADYEYEYTGQIGVDSKKYSSFFTGLGYLIGFLVIILGVFLLCMGFFWSITDYIWASIFFIMFGIYIFYKVRQSVKKRKDMEQALIEFEQRNNINSKENF